ncbi:MAG TPA: preprotein translocase subunit SecE [Candidatus Limnocylindria bacterium]|nr:preprotein translocase subunit SecE [Candidatus Limnocylindria bacterium]
MATATRPAGGIVRFAQESWSELRKVTWPTQEQVIRLTLLVVIISALVSVYIFAFDNVFHLIVDKGVLNIPDVTPAPPTQ